MERILVVALLFNQPQSRTQVVNFGPDLGLRPVHCLFITTYCLNMCLSAVKRLSIRRHLYFLSGIPVFVRVRFLAVFFASTYHTPSPTPYLVIPITLSALFPPALIRRYFRGGVKQGPALKGPALMGPFLKNEMKKAALILKC